MSLLLGRQHRSHALCPFCLLYTSHNCFQFYSFRKKPSFCRKRSITYSFLLGPHLGNFAYMSKCPGNILTFSSRYLLDCLFFWKKKTVFLLLFELKQKYFVYNTNRADKLNINEQRILELFLIWKVEDYYLLGQGKSKGLQVLQVPSNMRRGREFDFNSIHFCKEVELYPKPLVLKKSFGKLELRVCSFWLRSI